MHVLQTPNSFNTCLQALHSMQRVASFPGSCVGEVKITGSFAILDWLESLFSCRKPNIRQFLVLPLTIPVYCLRTTPRHVTEFVRGRVYWPSSVNSRACANSVYQALLSPLLEPGNEAMQRGDLPNTCDMH